VDTLLVIGQLTDQQCEPIVQKMREHGMDPQLVRFTTPYLNEGDFQNAAYKRVPSGLPDKRVEEYTECWIEQRRRELIREAFGLNQVDDVKGVVRLATDAHIDLSWLEERLPRECTEHFVHIGDNAGVWIEGDYGHLEAATNP